MFKLSWWEKRSGTAKNKHTQNDESQEENTIFINTESCSLHSQVSIEAELSVWQLKIWPTVIKTPLPKDTSITAYVKSQSWKESDLLHPFLFPASLLPEMFLKVLFKDIIAVSHTSCTV